MVVVESAGGVQGEPGGVDQSATGRWVRWLDGRGVKGTNILPQSQLW